MKLHYVEFPLYFAFLFSSSRRVDNESEFADSKDRGFDNGEYASRSDVLFSLFCTLVHVYIDKIAVPTSRGDRQKSLCDVGVNRESGLMLTLTSDPFSLLLSTTNPNSPSDLAL